MDKATLTALLLVISASCALAAAVFLLRWHARARKAPAAAGAEPLFLKETGFATPYAYLSASLARHTGRRAQQQDSCAAQELGGALVCAVCDGMGGMAMGAEASQLAVETVLASISGDSGPDRLLAALNAANEAVWEMCHGSGGSTAVIAEFGPTGFSYAAAGDSRIYLFRDGALRQLGVDHIFYYDLLRMARRGEGGVTAEEASSHPQRDHLTSYLGREALTRVNASDAPEPLFPGDAVVIVSDGVYKTLGEDVMAEILFDGGCAEELAREVLSYDRPAQDNLTAIVVRACEPRNAIKEIDAR